MIYKCLLLIPTCTGAIMTAWPPGDGMINAGMGLPPGGGRLRGRPRPRFTKDSLHKIFLLLQYTRTHLYIHCYKFTLISDAVTQVKMKTIYDRETSIFLPGKPRLARKFCTWLLTLLLVLGGLPLPLLTSNPAAVLDCAT